MKSSTQLIAELNARVTEPRRIPRSGPFQMPLWKEHLRGLPNALARGAVFTCGNRQTPRVQHLRTHIATLSNYNVFYTGTELRQDDADVFLQIVHFARTQHLGDVVEISGNRLLVALNWNSSAKSYKRLKDIIERLKEGTIKITTDQDNTGYAGSLIRKFAWQSEGDNGSRTKWRIYLEREIINLFSDDNYTLIDWADRIKLGQLAKWLHAFYYSHRAPIPYKVETLLRLSGSKASTLNGFRRDLKAALAELEDIGFLVQYWHDSATDTITVKRAEMPKAQLEGGGYGSA